MKKLLFGLLLLIGTGTACAAPYIRCDGEPSGNADTFVYQEGAAAPVNTPLVQIAPSPLKSCQADVSGFSVGVHNLQVWFTHSVFGGPGPKVPFAFTKPGAINTSPVNTQVAQ